MRRFAIKKSNFDTFTRLMKKNNPTEFAYSQYEIVNDRDYGNQGYIEVKFFNAKELKRLEDSKDALWIVGRRYVVIGGEKESHAKGHTWYFDIGEVIECIRDFPDGYGNYRHVGSGRRQTMDKTIIKYLIKPC